VFFLVLLLFYGIYFANCNTLNELDRLEALDAQLSHNEHCKVWSSL